MMRTAYKRSQSSLDAAAKNALVAEHAPMARRIALRVARRTPDWITSDELVAAAMLGLAEAVERYDATRGEPFVAFAEQRIRGAVLDELRRGDILPRRVRADARRVGKTIQRLEGQLGRTPEDTEIAEALGVDLETYQRDLEGLCHVGFVELPDQDREGTMDGGAGPEEQVERKMLVERVKVCLKRLPERDATLLSLYYVEEFTYGEIGEVLGVSESRVCQLHSRAMSRLRAEMEPEEKAA
jgi:RNA polymerase sigma factor for flagellar operon FliA